jgi:hypothetical protein
MQHINGHTKNKNAKKIKIITFNSKGLKKWKIAVLLKMY